MRRWVWLRLVIAIVVAGVWNAGIEGLQSAGGSSGSAPPAKYHISWLSRCRHYSWQVGTCVTSIFITGITPHLIWPHNVALLLIIVIIIIIIIVILFISDQHGRHRCGGRTDRLCQLRSPLPAQRPAVRVCFEAQDLNKYLIFKYRDSVVQEKCDCGCIKDGALIVMFNEHREIKFGRGRWIDVQ